MTPAEELRAAAERIREVLKAPRENATEAASRTVLFDRTACRLVADVLNGMAEQWDFNAQALDDEDFVDQYLPLIELARHILGRLP